jgi:hypothetical protein
MEVEKKDETHRGYNSSGSRCGSDRYQFILTPQDCGGVKRCETAGEDSQASSNGDHGLKPAIMRSKCVWSRFTTISGNSLLSLKRNGG